MEFLESTKDYLIIITGVLLFILFITYSMGLWGDFTGRLSRIMSKAETSEKLLSKDNITVKMEKSVVVIDSPKIFYNNVIVDCRHAHTFKLVIDSQSSRVSFEGGKKEIVKPVIGLTKIPIIIDSSESVLREQNVTVKVYLVKNDNEKLLKNLTFTIKPVIGLYFRVFPNKDTTILGVFDVTLSSSAVVSLNKIARNLEDITELNGQILLYLESKTTENIIVSVNISVEQNFKSDDSVGLVYVTLPSSYTESGNRFNVYHFKPVSQMKQEVSFEIQYRNRGEYSLIIPQLRPGVYNVNLKLSVYYNSVSPDSFLVNKTLHFKLASLPGEGFVITNAIALITPYSVQEKTSIWDLLLLLNSPIQGIAIGLQGKGYNMIGFIDYGFAYTPMPDSSLTERISGAKYNVKVKTINSDNKKILLVSYSSKDKMIKGVTMFYKIVDNKNKIINIYTLKYVYLDENVAGESFAKSSNNLKLIGEWIKSLTSDFNDKEYFPLYYSQDALVIVAKYGEKIKSVNHVTSFTTVCITNNKLPPSSYIDAFVKGDTSFIEYDMFAPSDVGEFKEEKGYDCADQTKFRSELLGASVEKSNVFQNTYLVKLNYLFAYRTYNSNINSFLSDLSDWFKTHILNEKLSIGDELHQEDFVKVLLYPDKYKAFKNLAIVHYYVISFKKGEYTVNVHVYSYTNYPLDKVRKLAKETCLKYSDDSSKCGS